MADQHDPFGQHNLDIHQRNGDSVCPYCHTPHRDTSAVPHWRGDRARTTFQTFDTTSVTGAIETGEGVSIACLTCHDGTQALDVAPNFVIFPPARQPLRDWARENHEHPIGVVYGGFRGRLQGYSTERLESTVIGGKRRWWLDAEPVVNGIRDKSDLILYGRERLGEEVPYVECPTCHDPHFNADRRFLRLPDVGSVICLNCHNM